MAGDKVVQVCLTKIVLLTIEGVKVKEWECPEGLTISSVGKQYLEASDTIFLLLSDGQLVSLSGSSLTPRFNTAGLVASGTTITALSPFTYLGKDYLALTYDHATRLRIYLLNDLFSTLTPAFDFSPLADRSPLLPNQLSKSSNTHYKDLMLRSITDPSCSLSPELRSQLDSSSGGGGTMEIHKENVRVRELEVVQMGSQLVMVAVMGDGMVDVYRNIGGEGFRFKLVEAQVLRKPIGVKGGESFISQMVHIVQDQVVVLDPQNPFMITQRKGRLYFHKYRPQLNIASIASLRLSKTSKE